MLKTLSIINLVFSISFFAISKSRADWLTLSLSVGVIIYSYIVFSNTYYKSAIFKFCRYILIIANIILSMLLVCEAYVLTISNSENQNINITLALIDMIFATSLILQLSFSAKKM